MFEARHWLRRDILVVIAFILGVLSLIMVILFPIILR